MKITNSSLAKVVGSGSGCFPLATFILAFFPPPSPPKSFPLWGGILERSPGTEEGKEALSLGSETRFLNPPATKKPGFCDIFCILTEILRRNPVSQTPPATKKPGFCDNFCLLTEILLRNPVSQPPRNQETGFLRQFLHPNPRFCEETRFLAPRNQETGFLRQFLPPTRNIYSETRFLAPRNQETGFLRQLLPPTRKICSETRFLAPPTRNPVSRSP
jgi:hypothetical protein